MTGISLNEYIRRRRLTAAGFELQQSDIKIIDLALKYGYNSPNSFTRAFEKMHGVTPSEAKLRGVVLKSYPKLIFYISIKGEVSVDYRIIEKEPFELLGKGIMVTMENVQKCAGDIWRKSEEDGTLKRMKKLSGSELPYGVTCYRYGRTELGLII